MLIIPPGFAQVIMPVKHAGSAREAMFTYGIDVSDAAGDYDAAADTCVNLWINNFAGNFDSEVVLGPATLRVGQDVGDPLSVEGSVTGPGTRTAASAPSCNALLVKKQTSQGGRRGRGRMFLPWVISESAINEVGMIDSGVVTTFASGLSSVRTGHSGTGQALVMVLLHGTGTSPTVAPSVINELRPDPLIGVQRRRLGR